jgi:cysteine desulfurase/selenocysteine lyase
MAVLTSFGILNSVSRFGIVSRFWMQDPMEHDMKAKREAGSETGAPKGASNMASDRQGPRLSPSEANALIRAEFSEVRGAYLDVAARGPLPLSGFRAAEAILRAQLVGSVPKDEWLNLANTVRTKAARLIGARPDEIALTKNTSEGLNIVAAGLPFKAGDRIVVAPSAEHPNNVLPWLWQAQTRGAEVVMVTPDASESLEQALISRIDERTKLVAVTEVDFGTGRRTDLTLLGNACRAHGAFLLVDAAQSSGVLRQDMATLPIDAWATATQKGLLSPYGLGLLYVRSAVIDQVVPAALARFSVDVAAGHEAAGPEAGWTLRAGAQRYEGGNYNYVGLAALSASLDLLLRIGADEVERRAVEASSSLRSAIQARGIPVLDVGPDHRSHILAIADKQGSGHDRADATWVNELSAVLRGEGIAHSVRRGALRLSGHIHVLPNVVDHVIGGVDKWQKSR